MASLKGPGRKARTAALLALVPGVIGLLLMAWPATSIWESDGLELLFLLRGPRSVPADRLHHTDGNLR